MTRPAATHELRAPTDLDQGARKAIMRTLREANMSAGHLVAAFLREGTYGDLDDYLEAVEEVYGPAAAASVKASYHETVEANVDDSRLDFEGARREAEQQHGPIGLLLGVPAADFLTTTEVGLRLATDPYDRAGRLAAEINRICEARGIHYRLRGLPATFEWTGDTEIETNVIEPALSVLDEPRLRGGPKTEFSSARKELRNGTPESRKQAVAEACNAVESTMKVLCDEKGVPRPPRATAQPLFDALCAAGLVSKEGEEMVLGPARFGNRRGRHGAGPVPHDVSEAEAEQVVAAAAVAIVYIAKQLP